MSTLYFYFVSCAMIADFFVVNRSDFNIMVRSQKAYAVLGCQLLLIHGKQSGIMHRTLILGSHVALVGGGNGFIGSAVCNSLKKRGYEVVVLSRTPGHSKITWVT